MKKTKTERKLFQIVTRFLKEYNILYANNIEDKYESHKSTRDLLYNNNLYQYTERKLNILNRNITRTVEYNNLSNTVYQLDADTTAKWETFIIILLTKKTKEQLFYDFLKKQQAYEQYKINMIGKQNYLTSSRIENYINMSFMWSDTPQGYEFWETLQYKWHQYLNNDILKTNKLITAFNNIIENKEET